MPLEVRKVLQSESYVDLKRVLPALSANEIEFRTQLPAAVDELSWVEA